MSSAEERLEVCADDAVDTERVARVQAAFPAEETLQDLAETFRALGDGTRVRLLFAIAREELCVHDLSVLLGITSSAVSHQLAMLKRMRLVRSRRDGRMVYYRLDDAHIDQLLAAGLDHVEEPANSD